MRCWPPRFYIGDNKNISSTKLNKSADKCSKILVGLRGDSNGSFTCDGSDFSHFLQARTTRSMSLSIKGQYDMRRARSLVRAIPWWLSWSWLRYFLRKARGITRRQPHKIRPSPTLSRSLMPQEGLVNIDNFDFWQGKPYSMFFRSSWYSSSFLAAWCISFSRMSISESSRTAL